MVRALISVMGKLFLLLFVPLAFGQFTGVFTGKDLRLELRADGAALAGTIEVQGQSFPVTARAANGQLAGEFTNGSDRFGFRATLQQNTIQGGSSTTATITLTGKTGPLGRTIALSSNNPKVIVPATLYVPPQKVSWTFTVQTKAVAANATYTITASQGAVVKTVDITLTP